MLNQDRGFRPSPCGFAPFLGKRLHDGLGTACRLWGSLRLNRSPLVRALLASAALGIAVALSGCNTDSILPMSEKAARPLPDKLVKEIESKNMDKESPILVRLFKEESELEVWKQDRSGRYALLKTYPICRWSGELGPKIKEGDRQAPEGFYNITPGQMNPNSQYYLSFDLGYPNAFDRAYGRTGAQLMVHGDCSSRGCYSMTDEQISEIYALGRDSFFGGQKSFQVQAYPFRMTPQNFAKHRNNPNIAFWKMLKKGNDHFEVSRAEPKVNVCDKRYVFDAEAPGGAGRLSFSSTGKCPVYEVSEEIASAVRDKERKDEFQIADLSRRNIPLAPIKTNADGGMHPVFVAAVRKNQLGVPPQEPNLFVSTAPGTIPVTVRPPRIPELADAPAVAGTAHSPSIPGEVSPPAMAIATQPAAKSGGSSMFGSLFSSKSSEPKTAEKSEGTLNRMARLVGLGGSDKDAKKAEAAPTPAPKPKPAAKPTSVASNGAIRTRQAEAEPVKTTEAKAPAQTAAAAPASPSMNGAAPVVPAGNFDNRWSGFR
jgi:murein L,D-transpeptidase YafK